MIQTQCVPNRSKTFQDIGSTIFQDVLVQGSTIFQMIKKQPRNSGRLQGNMKQVQSWGPPNTRLHRIKFGRPEFVHPRRSIYITLSDPLGWMNAPLLQNPLTITFFREVPWSVHDAITKACPRVPCKPKTLSRFTGHLTQLHAVQTSPSECVRASWSLVGHNNKPSTPTTDQRSD